MEKGEGCDELDRLDEDGCNVDCTVSGSLLWSWDPDRSWVLDLDFDAADALQVLVGIPGPGLSVQRFDATGEIDGTFGVTAVERPPGTPEGLPGTIEFAALEARDEGTYVGMYEYWQSGTEFFVGGHVEQLGDGGWVRPVEGGVQSLGPREGGGVIAVSSDDVVHAFDADGAEAWAVEPGGGLRSDTLLAEGAVVVVAVDRVVGLDDATGAELWSFVEPAVDIIFYRASRSADEIWAFGQAYPFTDEVSMFRLGLDGSRIEHIEAASMGSWHQMTWSGNVAWLRSQEAGRPELLEKLGADFEPLWAHEVGYGDDWRNLAVDTRGTVAAASRSQVQVLAP